MERTVLHCDCNSFFASVETVLHPEYAKVPMAVCGSQADRHGIVLAKNELAKRAGVLTGEVIWKAKQKCPALLIASPTYGTYSAYSTAINEIYYEYTDKIEPFGIDESWLDVTGSCRMFGDGKTVADALRKRIKREMGITISVGVSFNKTFAKLGSDYKKPDATTVISGENYKAKVFPLPVSALLFVGRHTVEKLHMLGIDNIGQLAAADVRFLENNFGKIGLALHNSAVGGYDGEVALYGEGRTEKSIGNGFTFKRDLMNLEDVRIALTLICDEVGKRMRDSFVMSKTITVGMRDTDLVTVTRRKTLDCPIYTAHAISDVAYGIVRDFWKFKKPLRSITVTASGLVNRGKSEQLKLFYSENELKEMRLERLERTADDIRAKFGKAYLVHGIQLAGSNTFL